jgi:hypothetical protein
MPQIVRTTNDVIINSLFLLGELGVGETPDAFMLETGLDLLNELLDKFAADSIYIPYLTTLNFVMNVGQDRYSISDMIAGTNIVADRIIDLCFANYIVAAVPGLPPPPIISFNFTASSITSQLTFSSTAAFPTGQPVTVASTGTLPGPLVAGVTYYAINLTPTIIYLALTVDDAMGGFPIPLTSNGTGLLTISTTIVPPNPVPLGTSLSYPVRIINKAQYYNVVRQIGLLARPGFVFMDKQATESFITYYPAPDQPYPASVQVKSYLNFLDNQDTLGELPPNYYGFLKYALARKFLSYYPSGNWNQTAEDEYQDYYMTVKPTNETDLTIRPSVTLTAPEPFYWPNILSY